MSAAETATTRQWLRRHRIRPRKRWGQNFLVSGRLADRIVAGWDLDPGCGVLEIGAGAGALTLPLLERGCVVVAIERDPRLCALLLERAREECPRGILRIREQDIRTLEPREALSWSGAPERWVLVGNLPYVITTPILEWTIRASGIFDWISFMVQREYAARLVASPGAKSYGSLTLWAAFHFQIEKELAVGAASFWPMPKVESVILRLTPRAAPPVAVPSAADLERVVRAAFSHRRKLLAGSLARGLGLDRQRAAKALRAAEIGAQRRAEECTLQDFAALTRILVSEGAIGGSAWRSTR